MAQRSIDLGLTDQNFKWIAEQLRCEPEMVMAFSKVECKRPPFDPDGFPAILYERHVFFRNLPSTIRGTIASNHPDLCARSGYGPGGYGTYGAQRGKLSRAMAIHHDAALEACSWGAFQELGENWADYGFDSVGEFVDEMKNGLLGQCRIFIKSIKHRGLVDEMQRRDFPTLARLYNGAGYRQFKYDEQISDQYDLAKARRINWASVIALPPPAGTRKQTEPLPPVQQAPQAVPEPQADALAAPEPAETTGGDQASQAAAPEAGQPAPEPALANPDQRVAVLKTKQPGIASRMWAKVTGAITGNAGFLWVQEKAESILNFGLPREFWVGLSIMLAVGTLIWLGNELVKGYQRRKKDHEMEALLVKENSTPTNTAQVIDAEDADLYRLKGYKVITS